MLNINIFKKNDSRKQKVFWWEPKDGVPNAGDHLAKVIVEQMLALKDKEIDDKISSKNKLLSIGSVIHFARTGDCIWGTGVNGKLAAPKILFQDLDVMAVRGPLTRDYLKNRGISVPEIYGDPGLLLPLLFNKELLMNNIDNSSKRDFIIIPHMNEDFKIYDKYSEHLCSPRQCAISFTRDIVNSSFVISGSLHGLIIAEAYGIPAVFLENNSGESRFKYDDYYFGSGRDTYPVVKNVSDAFDVEYAKPIDIKKITKGLISAFPYDLW